MHPSLDRIDLLAGFHAPNLHPVKLLKDAAAVALSEPLIYTPGLGYGPEAGYGPLRQSVAKWLTDVYQRPEPISAERICITGGVSQNLAYILQVFTDTEVTRYIWMVEPAYFLARRVFEDAGFGDERIKAIPGGDSITVGGIDLSFLEHAMEMAEKQRFGESCFPRKPSLPHRKFYKHVVYCVPTFSNPSGITMPQDTRESLVRLARKYDALVICDDVYDFLPTGMIDDEPGTLGVRPPRRIVDVDRDLDRGLGNGFGNVVSNGSFSKIVGPGCRVGWAEGSERFIAGLSQAGATRSGGAPSQLMSTFINLLLANGSLQKHLQQTLVPACAMRYRMLESAIRSHLEPLGVSLDNADGGYFVWLKLPDPLTARAVAEKALEEENLVIGHGELFAVSSLDDGINHSDTVITRRIRLCFMWENKTNLEEGVVRLARTIRRILRE